ncbi:MAG TPA: glycosyltransferase, partial [Candidatus Hydrogenedentes bacterium]|nr:glycosyltransferase [Candidatus Hydrogenedentota bacterium]
MRLVFLVPVFNERETLEALADGIARHTPQPDYRVLFVDDGSTDGSYEVMRALHQRDSRIGVLKLRGNHGKTRALAAGIARAEGDVLLTMDADLQDDPREIPKLLAKLEELDNDLAEREVT